MLTNYIVIHIKARRKSSGTKFRGEKYIPKPQTSKPRYENMFEYGFRIKYGHM